MHLPTLALLLCAPFASRQDAVIGVDDAASPTPGRTNVRPVTGGGGSAGVDSVINQMPGWPIAIGAHPSFAPWRGAVLADLDQDGDLEILVSSTDSRIHAFHHDGTTLAGFPVTTIGWCQYAPSVADLDGDGDLEIVQTTRGQTSGGRLYVLDHQGAVLPGFPLSFSNANVSCGAALADLDDDGVLEMIVNERQSLGRVWVVELDGSTWGGNWPFTLDHLPTLTAAVADVDGDGLLEIATASYNSMYLLRRDGTPLPGWPVSEPNTNSSYQSPAFADLDGDGDLEVVFGLHKSAAGYYAYHHDGTRVAGWPQLVGTWTYCPPTIADLENDQALEVLGGRDGTGVSPSDAFWAWTAGGATKPGFPYRSRGAFGGGSGGPLTVVDIDGDGVREVFSDHNGLDGGLGYIYGVDAQGNDLPNFPLRPVGFTYLNGADFGDVDGDGDIELCAVSVDGTTAWINLYDLDGVWNPGQAPWPHYHQDLAREGRTGGGRTLFAEGLWTGGNKPELIVRGEPGDFVILSYTNRLKHTLTPFGWDHLGTLRRTPVNLVPVPASGELRKAITVPTNPFWIGKAYYYQATVIRGAVGRTSNVLGQVVR